MARTNSLILFFLMVASVFFLLNRVVWQNLYLFSNSDFLYIPSLTRDYAEGIYNWKFWVLPPAPSFFPDLFLFFLISFFNTNLIISLAIYGVVLAIFLIWSTSSIFCLMEESFSFSGITKAVTIGFTFWFFILSFYPKDIGLFLVPSYHSSSFLFSVVFYSLIFRLVNIKRIFLFLFLSVLAIVSDKQILYTFYFPFLVTSFLFRNSSAEKKFWKTLIFLLVSFLIGALVLKTIASQGIFQIASIPIWAELKKNVFQLKMLDNIQLAFPEVKLFVLDFYTDKFTFFILFLFSIVLNLYYSLPIAKAKHGVQFLSQCILWVYFFSIFSQIFFGVWGGFRYMWAIYLIPYLSILYYIGIFLQMLLDRDLGRVRVIRCYFLLLKEKVRFQILFLVVTFLFFVLSGYFILSNKVKGISLDVPYPPFISCLDKIKDKYNLSYGLSDYWNAKHIRYLSHSGLIVNQTFTNLERYNWVHNRDWYEKDTNGMPIRYNFLIPERLDRSIIKNLFGQPDSIETCGGREVFIYKKGFIF